MDDGVSIAATLYVPDGAAPAGGWPALVFLHGLSGNRQQMNALVEGYGFTGQGFAVLTFDARGHGESGGLVGIDGPREVADTRAVRDWLAARPDVSDTKIGAWGISYGGGGDLQLARRRCSVGGRLHRRDLDRSVLRAHAAGPREVRPGRRPRRLDPAREARPVARRRAGSRVRRERRRGEAVGRRAVEPLEARLGDDARLHGAGPARLPLRDRPGRARIPAAERSEDAVRRAPRPRAVDVPGGGHGLPDEPGACAGSAASSRTPAAA